MEVLMLNDRDLQELLARAGQVGLEAEHRREARLIDDAITATARGGMGVIRLEDTLGAVCEGRVQTLIIQEEFRAPGFRCRGRTGRPQGHAI